MDPVATEPRGSWPGPLHFQVRATAGAARRGILTLRGRPLPAAGLATPWLPAGANLPARQLETPAFMPVGTRAAVKGVEPEALETLGYRLILANTYHLLVRPGPTRIGELGGLHRFMSWSGGILTDSGGFQAFSLTGLSRVTEAGVEFRSHLDGSRHALSPERAVEVQEIYDSDILMPLDICCGLPAPRQQLAEAQERTTRWLQRSVAALRDPAAHALFGIVQGGTEPDLRIAHAQELAGFELPGYALGGLSVGEKNEEMYAMVSLTTAYLPPDRPRYLMGVGTPEDIVRCSLAGIDLFDCVLPTRTARTGRLATRFGDLIIKNARYATDQGPLDPSCGCPTCRRFTRAYLRHLFVNQDPLSVRLLTLHNLSYYATLTAEVRLAIEQGEIDRFLERFQADRAQLGVRKKG